MAKVKQSHYDQQHTKKAKSNWKKRMASATGIDPEALDFDFDYEDLKLICDIWYEVLTFGKGKEEIEDIEIKNIVAIMGKDTRKTTVWMIILWFLLYEYEWLNGFVLRDTIDKAANDMKLQIRKAADLITNEYNTPGFSEATQEAGTAFFFVRDKERRDNQKIELVSFDSIVQKGGFTTNNGKPAIFVYDELQNPNSKNKEPISKATFLANYKFIDKKNNGIEITTGNKLPKWMARHIFLSNRYVSGHPLNEFSELHFPFYDSINDNGDIKRGVKTWMLKDPEKNNFIVSLITEDKIKEGWEDFKNTLIVYGGPLSNILLTKDKDWKKDALAKIRRGKSEDLAYFIGDLYEGYENGDKAYHYTRKDKIDRNVFHTDYAPYATHVSIGIDIDYNRQIRIRPKYFCKKSVFLESKLKEVFKYRAVREKASKITCNGISRDGAKTERYYQETLNKIIEITKYINKWMPNVKVIKILFDEPFANWSGRINAHLRKDKKWIAYKVDFKQAWPIKKRPAVIDEMQDTGFLIDIDDFTNTALHNIYQITMLDPKAQDKVRYEYSKDPNIDDINSDEYPLREAQVDCFNNILTTNKLGGKNEW
ncbi:MAG: hypothetical protein HRT98_04390 [Mycoplasmatales bacterium]|nr:hypothetical protein [Mycoplasmatales bacterium]